MENKKETKKSILSSREVMAFATILVFLLAFWAVNSFGTGKVVYALADDADVQIVKMKVEGRNYVLEPSSFKEGIPVRIEADMSKFVGCSQSVVISAFNVRKTLSSSDNIIEFTPDKAGTFNIACSMNMYRGTFDVLNSDGTKASYVEPAKTGGMACGSSGGGCGCGG